PLREPLPFDLELGLELGDDQGFLLGRHPRCRRLGAMELRLARCKLELALVELRCAYRHALCISVDLVAGERLACEHFRLARGDHDLARLEVGKAAETLALVREAALDPLFLRAELLLPCRERALRLFELREPRQSLLELRLADCERGRRLGDGGLARNGSSLPLLEILETLCRDP